MLKDGTNIFQRGALGPKEVPMQVGALLLVLAHFARGVAVGGAASPKTFGLSANLKYTISASRRWNARKAFFIGKFGLREVFFVDKVELPLLQNFPYLRPYPLL